MKRVKLTIAYDGTNYCGWQIQNNAVTIQEEIEKACQNLFSREISLIGASRTDTGVHAKGQVAILDIDTTIPTDRIAYALNSKLPSDIVILDSVEVSSDFHPRYNAVNKTYEYKIFNSKFLLPQLRLYSHFYYKKLDINKMKEAANNFVGEYDFKAFCSTGSSVKTTVREVYFCKVECHEEMINIQINGNGFLYNMVRIIVGTLIEVGTGKIKPKDIIEIIESGERDKAGPTVPAKGLTLVEINY